MQQQRGSNTVQQQSSSKHQKQNSKHSNQSSKLSGGNMKANLLRAKASSNKSGRSNVPPSSVVANRNKGRSNKDTATALFSSRSRTQREKLLANSSAESSTNSSTASSGMDEQFVYSKSNSYIQWLHYY